VGRPLRETIEQRAGDGIRNAEANSGGRCGGYRWSPSVLEGAARRVQFCVVSSVGHQNLAGRKQKHTVLERRYPIIGWISYHVEVGAIKLEHVGRRFEEIARCYQHIAIY